MVGSLLTYFVGDFTAPFYPPLPPISFDRCIYLFIRFTYVLW